MQYNSHSDIVNINTLEFTPIVCSWSITDTDSDLCESEDRVILQSIWNISIAPTLQFTV